MSGYLNPKEAQLTQPTGKAEFSGDQEFGFFSVMN